MNLRKTDTDPPKSADEVGIRNETADRVKKIGELQLKLYAEKKHSVLVIFQGMDASGKDGAIKDVFADVNPMGIRVICFKKPTEEELSHDFLWRIHQVTPPKGMIHIFNRSHYEDILVPSVEGYINEKVIGRRYNQINEFEKMLVESDTMIVKFFLHVSPKEQLERLEERMTNPRKFWKHKDSDWETSRKWDQYMDVYENIFKRCDAVPWHIIPSDKNWYKEYLVAGVIYDALLKLNPQYPPLVTGMNRPKPE